MKEDPSSFPFFNLTGLSSSSLAPWNCLSCPESDTYLPTDTSALQWAIEERVEGSHYPPQEDHTFISPSFLLSQFLMFLCRLPAFTHILALFCPQKPPPIFIFLSFSISFFHSGLFTIPHSCPSFSLPISSSRFLSAVMASVPSHFFHRSHVHLIFQINLLNEPSFCATEQRHINVYVPICKQKHAQRCLCTSARTHNDALAHAGGTFANRKCSGHEQEHSNIGKWPSTLFQ